MHSRFLRLFLLTFFIVLVTVSCDSIINESEEPETAAVENSNENHVVKIIDGDTYDVILDGEQTRIRMEGIDAPERGMDYYKVSKEYLGEICNNQKVKVVGAKKDRYGRLLAKTYLEDGREVGEEMVKAGMAWHFKKYSTDPVLARLENEAKNNRRGLWAIDNPIPPWKFRKNKKNKK